MSVRQRGVLFLLILALVTVTPGIAAASVIAPQLGPTWRVNTVLGTTDRPAVQYIVGFPTGAYRDSVQRGFTQWNKVNQNLKYQFGVGGSDIPSFNPLTTCSPKNVSAIFWLPIDGTGSVLADSNYCTATAGGVTVRYSAFIRFDRDEVWCTSTSDCPSPNTDMWSVASHESGHVSAIAHYDAASPVCADNSSQATMCPFYTPGSERFRTLSINDQDTLRTYY